MIYECTLAGVIDIISRQSLPFWWDDADKLPILEQLAVMAFNKVIIFVLRIFQIARQIMALLYVVDNK